MKTLTRRTFLAAATPAMAAQRKHLRLVHTEQEKIVAYYGDQPLLEHRYSRARPKTYVHPLYLPDGRPVSVDSPPDHVHLQGLMLAWSGVNGVDFWGEVNPARHGQIVHQRFERIREKTPLEIVSVQNWLAEGKLLLVERRTLRVPVPRAEGVWLEWISELTASEQPVTLSAERHPYNGLGIRFLPSMEGGSVLNANGVDTIAKANGDRAKWCAYYGALDDGSMAGVAIFDHPANPRYPTPFFVMNKRYGYLSAAPTFQEPFHLRQGETLKLRWGVLSFLGKPDGAKLNRIKI